MLADSVCCGKEKSPVNTGLFLGGVEGIRTPDPLHAMQVRSQLRHNPKVYLAYVVSTAVSSQILSF
jgi:hypothetical protein